MQLITELPFFYKSHANNDNGGFPQILPFDLYFDESLKMFRQKATPQLTTILNDVYKLGSLVEGSVSSESGKVYIDKIVDYILQYFDAHDDINILEVGFGSGVILKELKARGLQNLTGIEPGKHILVNGLEGINLINDFYPSPLVTRGFDIIYSLLVLEHIEEPLTFITDLIAQLNPNGKIILGVPNCEPYLQNGDVSIFIHEHYSYFTQESIENLISKTKFKIEDISIVEGAFIFTISSNAKVLLNKALEISTKNFGHKVQEFHQKLTSLISKFGENQFAVYVPTRAINSLFLINKTKVRLIDDNTEMEGKYLPSLSSAVESFESLINNPPQCVLIFSRTFGKRIKQRCEEKNELKNTQIYTLNDLDDLLN